MAEQQTDTESKPEQQVDVEEIGPARKKLTIELPESRIKDKIEESYGELQNEANLPGFRRGRAPRRLIERRFGEAVRRETTGQLLSEAYSQAVEGLEIEVVGEPDVKDAENIELPESGPLRFEVEIEVAPTVELPDFSQIKVEKPSSEVTDEDIEAELNTLRERMGSMQPVEGAQIKADDFVNADVKVLPGENADESAEPLHEQEGAYIFVPGESREYRGHAAGIIIEDLGKRLEGKQAGDVETISMTGPSGHENEQIRDQPITVRITLREVQRLEPAPLEDLIQRANAESEDDLRQQVRQMLETRRQQEQQSEVHRQISDQLLNLVELELPEGLTGRQTERVISRRRMELAYQGKNEQEVEEELAEMRSGSEEEARRELKLFFVLDKAARDLEIEVAQNEVNGQVAQMAMQQGRRPEKLRQELQQRGQLEQMYLQIRERKTLDKIQEQAQVTEGGG